MKFTVSQDIFLKGLQIIQSIIPTQTVIPMLYNVLLTTDKKNLYLTASDTYITMRCTLEANVKKAGISTVKAHRLLSIIRELPNESVDVEIDDKNTVLINCSSSSYKVFGVAADEFPQMSVIEKGNEIALEQGLFKSMLQRTIYAASTDDDRLILNGILISFNEQKLSVIATDGRRLAFIEQELEIPIEEQTDIVIPTKTVNELIKILKDEGLVKIKMESKKVSFQTDDILIVSTLLEGKYPNFKQVIPTTFEERVTVDRESLLRALRRVSLVTNKEYPSVKIDFSDNKMQISAITPDIGEAHETVPVKYSGKKIISAFNPEFLMDPLRNLSNDEVFLELIDETSPVVIKCDIPFLYVLMPLHLS